MSYPIQVSSQIIFVAVSEVDLTEGFKDVFNHIYYELQPSRTPWWIADLKEQHWVPIHWSKTLTLM